MTNAVAVEQLTKRFGGHVALGGVSLEVADGEVVGLVGPNGAGKTVFLSCIAGALRPTSGRVRVHGVDTINAPPERLCRLGVARTFQVPQPFTAMTALESVLVATTFGGTTDRAATPRERAGAALVRAGFDKDPETPIATLNTLDLKIVDLARALGSQPRILLLDELAAGLVTGQLGGFIETVRGLAADGLTVIIVEHVIETITSLCPRLVVLDRGEVLDDGATHEVMRNPRVVEAYLGTEVAAA
ncbi:MAG: ATP-binding cassette domain-containing protein [Streptosporangiales bacterium]|nr:ATP-binding cassette domain-containing protein [Streptosporangiales bacterium]